MSKPNTAESDFMNDFTDGYVGLLSSINWKDMESIPILTPEEEDETHIPGQPVN